MAVTHNSKITLPSKASSVCIMIILAMIVSITSPAMVIAALPTKSNYDGHITSTEISKALHSIPNITSASEGVKIQKRGSDLLGTYVNGTSLSIPKNSRQSITVDSTMGQSVSINLPVNIQIGSGKEVAPGVVAYESSSGWANVVQAEKKGGVRMLTVIDSPSAPSEYSYRVDMPNQGRIILHSDGSALILDKRGDPAAVVATPWAYDAKNVPVKTWYTTDGRKLVQHIKHTAKSTVYPVIADPFWFVVIPAWILRACGVGYLAGTAGYWIGGGNSLKRAVGSGVVGCIGGILGKRF